MHWDADCVGSLPFGDVLLQMQFHKVRVPCDVNSVEDRKANIFVLILLQKKSRILETLNLLNYANHNTIAKNSNILKKKKKIPHTGDKASLDRCG